MRSKHDRRGGELQSIHVPAAAGQTSLEYALQGGSQRIAHRLVQAEIRALRLKRLAEALERRYHGSVLGVPPAPGFIVSRAPDSLRPEMELLPTHRLHTAEAPTRSREPVMCRRGSDLFGEEGLPGLRVGLVLDIGEDALREHIASWCLGVRILLKFRARSKNMRCCGLGSFGALLSRPTKK